VYRKEKIPEKAAVSNAGSDRHYGFLANLQYFHPTVGPLPITAERRVQTYAGAVQKSIFSRSKGKRIGHQCSQRLTFAIVLASSVGHCPSPRIARSLIE
jgi:hypothetical protein